MRLLRFLRQVLIHGKFYYSGCDFAERRIRMLADLAEFCPSGSCKRPRKAWLMRNRYLRAWISEAAYFARSFRSSGGHLILHEAQLWYIRIPRAASTAFSRSILLEEFPRLKNLSPSVEQINFLTDLYLQRTLFGYSKTTRVITVVRNPYSRIVSVYRQFFERPSGSFLYEDYLFGIFQKKMSFENFVQTLQLIPDQLKDQHLRPQHTFLRFYEQRNIKIDVLKLEEPGTIIEALQEVGISFEAFNESETPYDYRAYYTPHTCKLVYSIYQEDFRRFRYDSHLVGL